MNSATDSVVVRKLISVTGRRPASEQRPKKNGDDPHRNVSGPSAQLHEAGRGDVIAPSVEIEEASIAIVTQAFLVVPSRI
jgi:hypothetical protein